MNFFDDLQKKPVAVRKKIMWLGTIACGLIIFFLWLFVFPHSPAPSKKEQKNSQQIGEEFTKLKDELGKQTSKLNMGDLTKNFGSLEDIIKKDLNKKNGSSEEKKLNEIPRLPLE